MWALLQPSHIRHLLYHWSRTPGSTSSVKVGRCICSACWAVPNWWPVLQLVLSVWSGTDHGCACPRTAQCMHPSLAPKQSPVSFMGSDQYADVGPATFSGLVSHLVVHAADQVVQHVMQWGGQGFAGPWWMIGPINDFPAVYCISNLYSSSSKRPRSSLWNKLG